MRKVTSVRKIIVITPVKNEDWILERFLWACSQFADHIVLLNQGSTDRTVEIINQFEKAAYFDNLSTEYDEAFRTEFLVGKVRELYGLGNLIVALDADEIPTFPSLDARLWKTLKQLDAGTTVVFAKPDLLSQPMRYLPGTVSFPLAYLDDGAATQKKRIHNRRIPSTSDGAIYFCQSIVILHFARIRQYEYFARQAMYCVVENINCTKSWRMRALYYSPQAYLKHDGAKGMPLPSDWSQGYLEHGIDLYGYGSRRFNDFHRKVLDHFKEHGTQRFWMDDIWHEDWQRAAKYFTQESNSDFEVIEIPGQYRNMLRRFMVSVIFILSRIKSACSGHKF